MNFNPKSKIQNQNGECRWNYITNDVVVGSNPTVQPVFLMLNVAQSGRARSFIKTLSPFQAIIIFDECRSRIHGNNWFESNLCPQIFMGRELAKKRSG
jgi:hypothetical protein